MVMWIFPPLRKMCRHAVLTLIVAVCSAEPASGASAKLAGHHYPAEPALTQTVTPTASQNQAENTAGFCAAACQRRPGAVNPRDNVDIVQLHIIHTPKAWVNL